MPVEERSYHVSQEDAGTRLDAYLARRDDMPSRTRIQELIRREEVRVDGQVVRRPGTSLEWAQEILIRLVPEIVEDNPSGLPSGELPQLRILYEDGDLLAIDKQPGVTAHRTRSTRDRVPNVSDLARHEGFELAPAAGEDRIGIVHRLDKDTSGVMVLAKHDESLHFLKSQFKQRTAQKEYLALVWGQPRFDSDWIERPLAVHPKQGDRMVVARDGDQAKEAATYYEVVERFDGFALVRCRPRTGRTHQIRVHMTSVGHSLVGDRIYVSRNAQQREVPEGAPDPGRQCLHARQLTLTHPRTREEIVFEAPVPADIEALIGWLRTERPL